MMAAVVARCKQLPAAKQFPPLFHTSKSHFSTPTKSSKVNNYYIRKRRKWPIQPYKHLYAQRFAFKLAMHSFKQSIKKSKPNNLLQTFINSFSIYQIDPTPQSFHFLFKLSFQNRFFRNQIPLIIDHVEKVENFETPECVFIDLIKFYGRIFMFSEAVELFFRIPKFRCVPSVESLNALLLVLCRNEKGLEIVPYVLRKSVEMNIRIEESSFTVLIRALCRIGKVDFAYQLLCCMDDEGYTADQKLLSLILQAKCNQRNDKEGSEVKGFLWDLKMLGFEPKRDDFCNVIRYLVEKGKSKSALEVLKQMKMDGVKPDVMCYNLVLDGLFSDKLFSRAEKVFDDLLGLGLVPDVDTYNVYIWGLCMQNKIKVGMEILGSMEELGCIPTLNTYISVLVSLCEAGELGRVREVMNSMSRNRVQLNSAAYEIMIDRLVSNGNIDSACNFLNEMLDKNFVPMPTFLDKIICWLCKNDLYVKAVELFEGVIAKNIAPGSKAWESLIQGSGIPSLAQIQLFPFYWEKSVRSAQQGKIKGATSFLNVSPPAKDIILESNFEYFPSNKDLE